MKLRICVVERPRAEWLRTGVDEYVKRLKRYGAAEVVYARSGTCKEEGERLLAASTSCRRILLDEHGTVLTTTGWAERFEAWDQQAVREVAWLIGGAEGHSEAVRSACDDTWSLSALTLQHELALVVLLEQLYRVQSFRRGHPYHREG